ncbi:hypothetical protein LTR53_014314 [Teratosphaeriaceae sp. CCFEE 6253]|nr:hypothetical protein LTR53_014314 [Teratosphaeriaceae sp. CCFEE 6253]
MYLAVGSTAKVASVHSLAAIERLQIRPRLSQMSVITIGDFSVGFLARVWSGTMASSTSLQLFPSSPHQTLPPRKSSLKRRPPVSIAQSPGQLQGLAIRIASGPASSRKVLPASDTIKHSLFCEPPAHSAPDDVARLLRRQRARRLSSRPASIAARRPGPTDTATTTEDDKLAPLPVNTRFGSLPRPGKILSQRLQSSAVSEGSSVIEVPAPADDDQLSPLVDKSRFLPASPRSPEYPEAIPARSATSTPYRSTSVTASTRKASSPPVSMPSIFPQYDPGKTLNQQHYYPTETSYAQSLPSDKISKVGSPTYTPTLRRFDSALALVDGYEHIPFADSGDLLSIWNASNDHFPVAGRKVQLGLHQPAGRSTTITVGTSAKTPLFSMATALPQSPSREADDRQCYSVEKHYNKHDGLPKPVAQLTIREHTASDANHEPHATVIFPQIAAIRAIEAVSNSPAAAAIARFDPRASSPEAARLGQDAVAEARKRYTCSLTRTTRKRDSLGAVVASYDLEHPALGTLAITVTKKIRSSATRETRAKISLHHPSATPAAIAADTLVLAFLDFARDACVLDLPGLLALDSAYLLDTIITALFAVAAIENNTLMTEAITFAPPPTAPLANKKALAKTKKSERWSKRSSRVIDKMQQELIGSPADVAAPVQGAIKVIGFSLKAAVYALEAGVRLGVKIVVKVASK